MITTVRTSDIEDAMMTGRNLEEKKNECKQRWILTARRCFDDDRTKLDGCPGFVVRNLDSKLME